jgi:DNA-binding GntR family transcriptional regulator
MASSSKRDPEHVQNDGGESSPSPGPRQKARKVGTSTFQSGRKFKKKDAALTHLREEILNQNLKPGSLITAKGLSEAWGISRTPIRGAIDVLVKEGLLKRIGEAGAVVREINAEELYELLTLRLAIETRVARRLACMKTDEMIQKLERINAKIKAADGSKSEQGWPGYYEFDIEFHIAIARLANMQTAATWITELMNQFRLYVRDSRGTAISVYDEHVAIIESLRAFRSERRQAGFRAIECSLRDHFRGTAERWAVNITPWIDSEWVVLGEREKP